MKPGVCPAATAVAIVAGLVVMAGCGGASSSSSGDASHDHPESAATAIDRTAGAIGAATTKQPLKPQELTGKKKGQEPSKGKPEAESQLPLGMPLKAGDPRVKKVIAGLLHPDDTSQGHAGSGRGESQEGAHQNGALGILDQIRRAAREQLDQPAGNDHGQPEHGKGLGILEMLR
jgi:hypothetical protein